MRLSYRIAIFDATRRYKNMLQDGQYVMIHSRYSGVQPKALVGFDIFRVENGKVQEHWDALVPEMEPSETLAGNRMFSGPL
jgi:predicted SnoaL-like aldol condensation-catalyzing enzyme